MRRTQIYLDDEQTARLDQRASDEGTSRSTLIRRAVDEYLTQEERDVAAWRAQWQNAVRETSGIASHLDEGAEYVESVRRGDAKRLAELDR